MALEQLLSLAPRPEAPSPHEEAHAALAPGVDAERMAAFVAWVRAGVTDGEEPYPREKSWACKRVMGELEESWAA